MDFTGKTILITGASSGIGYALAKSLAVKKCNLALLARRKNLLDELASSLKDTGSSILSLKCDVADKGQTKSALNEITNHFGHIDIAILNAGIDIKVSTKNFNSKDAKEVFDVNLFGVINFIEDLLPSFLEKRQGMIVGISSLADARGFPKSGIYCSSKSALSTLLESLRNDLKKYNIKVLTVKPGFVKTPMTDKNNFKMPFIIDLDKAVKIILNGIEKEKRIIQFPMRTALGAKLLKLLPDSIFDLLANKMR